MQAIVLVLSVIYVVLTLAADLLNALLDPRLRVAYAETSMPISGRSASRRCWHHRRERCCAGAFFGTGA